MGVDREYKYKFVYLIVNNINNNFYIGSHCTNKLEDGYMGSGYALKRAFKKYGKENFTREIFEFCDTLEELKEREEFWIKDLDAVNKGYNIVYNSMGGYLSKEIYINNGKILSKKLKGSTPWNKGKKGWLVHSEETKERIRQSLLETYKDPKIRAKCGSKGEKNSFYGKKHSQESIDKMKSHSVPKETRERISKTLKSKPFIKCPHCGLESRSAANMKRYHFENCKLKNK